MARWVICTKSTPIARAMVQRLQWRICTAWSSSTMKRKRKPMTATAKAMITIHLTVNHSPQPRPQQHRRARPIDSVRKWILIWTTDWVSCRLCRTISDVVYVSCFFFFVLQKQHHAPFGYNTTVVLDESRGPSKSKNRSRFPISSLPVVRFSAFLPRGVLVLSSWLWCTSSLPNQRTQRSRRATERR